MRDNGNCYDEWFQRGSLVDGSREEEELFAVGHGARDERKQRCVCDMEAEEDRRRIC